ncbi:MAG: glycosyltransferase family 2 protein [Candidatus Omnitrophica bacterium]|nr:glycosyltransferase family 2 protein [Candidatus Omnitrophota bacterium]
MLLKQFNTPVALIVFNRPETTSQVLSAIRKVKPKQLFVIADGPRTNNLEDKKNCELVRKIIDDIDWDCQIYKKYSEINLGCGKGPSNGISWVFNNVNECIILEDDCIPDLSFFRFCEELLEKYRYDCRIMMISGNYHLLEKKRIEYSYFFSRNTQTWGWATWKRAWDFYDYEMTLWPEVKKSRWLERVLGTKQCVKYWERLFDECYKDKTRDYWDYQWTFCCWAQNALNIIPDRNLVTNIGVGDLGGSHFTGIHCPFVNLPVYEIEFPLRHPPVMIQHIEADNQIQKDVYGQGSLCYRIKSKLGECARELSLNIKLKQ